MPSSAIGEFVIGESPIGGYGVAEKILPSYLYTQYNDDPGLQALVEAFNRYAQAYLDYLNDLELPVYTRAQISGLLLDWVAEGLYGITRPVLPSGKTQEVGAYNTFVYNSFPYNGYERIGPAVYYVTSDDVFKRILTWCFFKGDGFQFNVRWLKRRVARFLFGENGQDPGIDQTYQISVSWAGTVITIRILSGIRTVTGGAFYNSNCYNTAGYNVLQSTFQALDPVAMAATLKAAIDAGVLPLPFQFTYNVQI